MSTRRRDFRRVVRAQCLPVPFFPTVLWLFSNLRPGTSKHATKDDIPHGANEFIALKQQNVGEVRGVVSFGEIGNPTEHVVAEIYRFKGDDTFPNIEKVIASKPAAACITGRDGPFSFPYLEPRRTYCGSEQII